MLVDLGTIHLQLKQVAHSNGLPTACSVCYLHDVACS